MSYRQHWHSNDKGSVPHVRIRLPGDVCWHRTQPRKSSPWKAVWIKTVAGAIHFHYGVHHEFSTWLSVHGRGCALGPTAGGSVWHRSGPARCQTPVVQRSAAGLDWLAIHGHIALGQPGALSMARPAFRIGRSIGLIAN